MRFCIVYLLRPLLPQIINLIRYDMIGFSVWWICWMWWYKTQIQFTEFEYGPIISITHKKYPKVQNPTWTFNWCNILPFVGCCYNVTMLLYNEITLFIPFNSELFILVAFLIHYVKMNIDNGTLFMGLLYIHVGALLCIY